MYCSQLYPHCLDPTGMYVVGAQYVFGGVHNHACTQVNKITYVLIVKRKLTDLPQFDPISHPCSRPDLSTELWNSQCVINKLPLSSLSGDSLWPALY